MDQTEQDAIDAGRWRAVKARHAVALCRIATGSTRYSSAKAPALLDTWADTAVQEIATFDANKWMLQDVPARIAELQGRAKCEGPKAADGMSNNYRSAALLPAVGVQAEQPAMRLLPERATPLSHRQRETLKEVPDDWGDLPAGIGCTNATLDALKRRDLVETRIEPSKRLLSCGGWQWRRTPNGR